jgi:hypothetical protein
VKKTNDLSTLSVEELIEKRRKTKSAWVGISIPMALVCIFLVYLAIKLKNYALIAVGIGSAITLLPGFAIIAEIDKELKKRNESSLLK